MIDRLRLDFCTSLSGTLLGINDRVLSRSLHLRDVCATSASLPTTDVLRSANNG